jgi:hypothetical protein
MQELQQRPTRALGPAYPGRPVALLGPTRGQAEAQASDDFPTAWRNLTSEGATTPGGHVIWLHFLAAGRGPNSHGPQRVTSWCRATN